MRLVLAVLLSAGCASNPSVPSTRTFATRGACEKVVDHLDALVFLQTAPGIDRNQLFRAPNLHPVEHTRRVDSCTIQLSQADADCILAANDLPQVDNCQRELGTVIPATTAGPETVATFDRAPFTPSATVKRPNPQPVPTPKTEP